jgi:carbon monoxide dehydrogenase subunit G
MLKIESNTVTVLKPITEVFEFLINLNNTSKLMPHQVTNWQGNEKEVSYILQGMATIKMFIQNYSKPYKIEIKSLDDKPFSFTIDYLLDGNDNQTNFKIVFQGDVNLFMKAMVEKPLSNLFNYMVEQLPKQFS